jgi:hypothetical protein
MNAVPPHPCAQCMRQTGLFRTRTSCRSDSNVAQYSEESRRRRSVKANLAFVNGEGDHNLPPEDKDAAVDG